MDDTRRVDVLEPALKIARDQGVIAVLDGTATYEDLVEEVLDELLLEGARSEQSMQVGSEELGDKIAARK